MSTFKATTYRLNSSTQYADQLWLNALGAIATPSTGGVTESVKAAYLDDGSLAVPTVFGSMSWKAPMDASSGRCTIKLFDGEDTVDAVTIEPSVATFNGDCIVTGRVLAAELEGPIMTTEQPFVTSIGRLTDLTVEGPVYLTNAPHFRTPYSLYVDPETGGVSQAETPYAVTTTADDAIESVAFSTSVTFNGRVFLPSVTSGHGSGVFLTFNPSTGEVLYTESSAIGAYETTGELPSLAITDTFQLINAPTLRTPYSLFLEPMTGLVTKAATPYAVATVGDVIESVAFSANVIAGHVSAGSVETASWVQVGSGSEVWRLRPDAASGSLAVEKLEGGVWVAKSLLGSS